MRKTVFAALVESHDNIGAEIFLHFHSLFGGKEMFASVDVGGKFHARIGNFIELCERKDLKPAAVRQNGPVPIHEGMKPARFFYDIVAGAHVEVIGICEDDLRARLLQIARKYALDGRLRSHGHINGRFGIAVRGMQNPRPRPRIGIGFNKFKRKKFVVHEFLFSLCFCRTCGQPCMRFCVFLVCGL